jgi:uncharacterized membrane protein YedE/YeeE
MERKRLVAGALGILFGFAFTGAQLNQYDTIHDMLSLQNFAPYLIMASAIATAAPLLWLMERRHAVTRFGGAIALQRWRLDRDKVTGGVIFGIGWAITGACPGTASTAMGSGSLMGIVLIAGIMTGIRMRDIHASGQRTIWSGPAVTEPASG